MNRKLIAAVLAVSTTMSLGAGALADDEISVLVNNEKVVFPETKPFIENERTLVPMREIFEALGADVTWDDETKTIISFDTVSNTSITMQIDSDKMFVGETEVLLDVPAKIVGSSTVVPVRAVAEGMKSVVGWDQETQTVTVEKEMGSAEVVKGRTEGVNIWAGYKTIEELNVAINEAEYKYAVSDLKTEGCNAEEYRYLKESNLSEIIYTYNRPDSPTGVNDAEIAIRTQPGDTDISGIYGGTKVEEYEIERYETKIKVEIYEYENIMYAIWSCENGDTVFSYSVAIESTVLEKDVLKTLVKTVVDDFELNQLIALLVD